MIELLNILVHFNLFQCRLEQEKKEKKKQKEKERKERLKAEGKLLTAKQKADRARAQALIDSLKAQGVALPDVGEKKPRLGTRIKPNKQKKEQASDDAKTEGNKADNKSEAPVVEGAVDTSAEKSENVGKPGKYKNVLPEKLVTKFITFLQQSYLKGRKKEMTSKMPGTRHPTRNPKNRKKK